MWPMRPLWLSTVFCCLCNMSVHEMSINHSYLCSNIKCILHHKENKCMAFKSFYLHFMIYNANFSSEKLSMIFSIGRHGLQLLQSSTQSARFSQILRFYGMCVICVVYIFIAKAILQLIPWVQKYKRKMLWKCWSCLYHINQNCPGPTHICPAFNNKPILLCINCFMIFMIAFGCNIAYADPGRTGSQYCTKLFYKSLVHDSQFCCRSVPIFNWAIHIHAEKHS